MIKTGICFIKGLISDEKNSTLYRRPLKNASISLYEEACNQENADTLVERILFTFSDERGAYKRTYSKRFEVFDEQVCEMLRENFDGASSLTFHDAGVSDGRTAVDFFRKVNNFFPKVHYTASDYDPIIHIVEKGHLKIAVSDSGRLLEILWSPFVFNMMKRDAYLYFPLNHIIKNILYYCRVVPLLKSYKKGKILSKKIRLFSPAAINLEKENKKFHLCKYNLLFPMEKKYNVIRAMNVLNPSYFSNQQFGEIINNIYASLEDDGIFITGSNQDADTLVDGGVYKKVATGFKGLMVSGKGSPIHNCIESL